MHHGVLEIDNSTQVLSWEGSQDLDGYRDLKRLVERKMLRFMNGTHLLKELPINIFSTEIIMSSV